MDADAVDDIAEVVRIAYSYKKMWRLIAQKPPHEGGNLQNETNKHKQLTKTL